MALQCFDSDAGVPFHGLDIRDLAAKVEALARLEARVAAIDRRIP
jgi:hypothetical protein